MAQEAEVNAAMIAGPVDNGGFAGWPVDEHIELADIGASRGARFSWPLAARMLSRMLSASSLRRLCRASHWLSGSARTCAAVSWLSS